MLQTQTVVVLLNWNGARDTIECLESLLEMDDQDFVVIVCDNLSSDNSFHELQNWGKQRLGDLFKVWVAGEEAMAAKVFLVQTGANLGFAGGCNVGLRFALLMTSAEFIWLLNNDTVVASNSLGEQLQTMRRKRDVGILGSTLLFYDDRETLQAPGGYSFNFWTARVRPIGQPMANTVEHSEAKTEKHLEYISGASMLIRRSLLEEVGLLNEQYFLYFEEVDLAIRAKALYKLGYCSQSYVWHKEGRSIGSSWDANSRSTFSEKYLSRNRVLFMKTYFPARLPVCLLWMLTVAVLRTMVGKWRIALISMMSAIKGLGAPITTLPTISSWPKSMLPKKGNTSAV